MTSVIFQEYQSIFKYVTRLAVANYAYGSTKHDLEIVYIYPSFPSLFLFFFILYFPIYIVNSSTPTMYLRYIPVMTIGVMLVLSLPASHIITIILPAAGTFALPSTSRIYQAEIQLSSEAIAARNKLSHAVSNPTPSPPLPRVHHLRQNLLYRQLFWHLAIYPRVRFYKPRQQKNINKNATREIDYSTIYSVLTIARGSSLTSTPSLVPSTLRVLRPTLPFKLNKQLTKTSYIWY